MGYYTTPKYKLSSHCIRRYTERNKGQKFSQKDIESIILKDLENTYEGPTLENGDKILISLESSKKQFIVSSDNTVITFVIKK